MDKQLDYGSYSSYRRTVASLVDKLNQLLGYCEEFSLSNSACSIKDTISKVSDEHFEVAIVGEFKRGKSTLINALLGQEILPADVLPATATLNRVTYNENPYVQVEYKNGKSEKVSIEQLGNYVTKLTAEAEETAETVKEATVYYDTDFCKNHVDIIDTPGLNDDEQMTNVTLSILPTIDAAVFVISANSPFSQFEKDFLESKMLTSDVGRIIFIVNCFGTFSPADEQRIVDTVRTRITKYVMEKAKKVMGEDSKEFEVYKRKIGVPKVIGVYAKKALDAKQQHDEKLLEESNFKEFENALETMLTKERGTITLQIMANKVINAGTEVLSSITLRQNALAMEYDEFMEKYKSSTEEIEDLRRLKRQEFVKINNAANQVFENLMPILDNYWRTIEEAAMQVIDNFEMTQDDLKPNKLKTIHKKLNDKIKETIENKAQLICEQIQNEINIAISDEAQRLQDFEDEFFAAVARIQQLFAVSEKHKTNGGVADQIIGATIGTAGSVMGGIFLGFREAGIKGALLGGSTGFASFTLTYYAAIFFTGILGVSTIAVPVTLCLVAIAGLTGTFTGKFAVDKLLVKERISKFKEDFKSQVRKQFHEMKVTTDFTETVRQQVVTAFDGLKSKIEDEAENILSDTQDTLDNLNKLKESKTTISEKENDNLSKIRTEISTILADAYVMHKELTDTIQAFSTPNQKNKQN